MRIRKSCSLSFSILPGFATRRQLTKDLSVGGARIMVGQFLPLRSILKLRIEFPDVKKTVTAVGMVQWNRSIFDDECYEAGIRFIEVNKEDEVFLRTYLRGVYSAQKASGLR